MTVYTTYRTDVYDRTTGRDFGMTVSWVEGHTWPGFEAAQELFDQHVEDPSVGTPTTIRMRPSDSEGVVNPEGDDDLWLTDLGRGVEFIEAPAWVGVVGG